MDFSPNELQKMLQDSAASYAADRVAYGRDRSQSAAEPGYSLEDWSTMAELGWLALQLPEEHGGIGGGPVEIMSLMQALGGIPALEPFLSTAVIGARAIVRHGSATQRGNLLPRLAAGKLRLAWAHDEAGAVHHTAAVASRALAVGPGYVLRGEKSCVLDAPTADKLIVSARVEGDEDEGIGLFLVDANAPGLECRHFTRLDGGRASHLRLTGVAVPAGERIGATADGQGIIADLTRFAIAALCAEALGAMQALHDQTLEYLKMRQQFGRPIGQFQALQHRQVDMLMALEQARSLVMAACMALAEEAPDAERLLSMAKVTVGRAGRCVAQGAVQLHGGVGMTAELRIGAYFKRLAVIDTLFGSADQHLRMLAKLQTTLPL